MPVYRNGHAITGLASWPPAPYPVLVAEFDTFTPAEAGALDRLALRIEADEHHARDAHEELFLDRFQDRRVA